MEAEERVQKELLPSDALHAVLLQQRVEKVEAIARYAQRWIEAQHCVLDDVRKLKGCA